MQIEGVLALTDGFPDVVPMTAGSSTPVPEWHVPIMVDEVVELLRPRPGAVIVDGTVGAGGHSISVVPRLIPDGRLIAVDRDPEALRRAKERLVEFESLVTFLHDDYRRLPEILQDLRISRIDGLILDLGVSSLQLGSSQRGFSFSKEGPLDMRMDLRAETTAEELVNRLPVEELARIFETFGEERFARRIARCIGQERHRHPITTTTQLAHLIVRAVPSGARHGRLHPATRVFQALRIAVNDELGALERCLTALPELLNPGGRAVILTFHSLEDRLVKRSFVQGMHDQLLSVLTKKPLRPDDDEVASNPRARSAKLRAVERGESQQETGREV